MAIRDRDKDRGKDLHGQPERIAVIGLGRFGMATARALHELGYDVVAIDIHSAPVESAAAFVSLSAQGDGSDEQTLRGLQVDRCDVAIVAQGENLEASMLTAHTLKTSIGVPWVIAKARSYVHGELLAKIGVDKIVYPEREAGIRLAHSISVRHINDYISMTATSGIAKVIAPPYFVGETVAALDTSKYKQLNLLMIRRGRVIMTAPSYDTRIEEGDELVLVGEDRELSRFLAPRRLSDT